MVPGLLLQSVCRLSFPRVCDTHLLRFISKNGELLKDPGRVFFVQKSQGFGCFQCHDVM